MKLTKSKLKQIIKEEIKKVLSEADVPPQCKELFVKLQEIEAEAPPGDPGNYAPMIMKAEKDYRNCVKKAHGGERSGLKELGPVGHYAKTGRLKPSQGDMETKSKCEKLLMRLDQAKDFAWKYGATAATSHDDVMMQGYAQDQVRGLEQELAALGCHEDGA